VRRGRRKGEDGREVTHLKQTITLPFSLRVVYKGRVPCPLY